ncbi:MAG: hypothetical protein KBS97_02650 [Firmicutes bacterium]|nr:hypothetical protein [Candidatus Fiminaster equi]
MENNGLKTFNPKDIISEEIDMKSIIDELFNSLKEDEEVYELIKPFGLTNKQVRENIGRLNDFKEDYNVCKNCPGYDKCPKAEKHISMYVAKDGNYIKTAFQPCPKALEKARLDAKYVFSDFPSDWKKSTLKKLDLSENRRPVIKEFINIAKGKSNRWIYLTGNHKVGKSYILVTFANEYIAMGLGQVGIINAVTKFKELADVSFKEKEYFKSQMNALINVPLLVIDDFGEEYKNEFIRDQIVIPVLSERNHNNRPTFFSSDFTIKEIEKLYSVGKNGGDIRGKQLGKILLEMCEKEFDLTGASIYRK